MVNISTCAFPCEQENNLGSLTVETREKECSVMEIVTWYPYCDAEWITMHYPEMAAESIRGTENTPAQAPSDPWFIKTQQTRLKYTNIPNMWADM